MVDNDAPENISRQTVISMDNVVPGIHNLSCIGDVYLRINLQNAIHCLTHNLNVSFYCLSQQHIGIEIGK